jgi:hypothetical protein
LFSIADHHKNNKDSNFFYDKNGDPWISDEDWDKTKAEYCKLHNISFCFDDTARYAKHFETPFAYMTIQNNKIEPNKYLDLIIDMFNKRRENSAKIIDVKNQMVKKTTAKITVNNFIINLKAWCWSFFKK